MDPSDLLSTVLNARFVGVNLLRPVRDGQGRVRDFEWAWANSGASAMSPFPGAGLIGCTLLEVYPEAMMTGLFQTCLDVLGGGQPREMDEHFIHPDGEDRWMHVRLSACDQGLSLVYTDITDAHLVRQTLEESEARYRTLFEGSLQGITVHRGMEVLFVNEAWLSIFGFESTGELIRHGGLAAVVPMEDRQLSLGRWSRLVEEGGSAHSKRMVRHRADGSMVVVDVLSQRVEWMGCPAVQSTVLDVTQSALAEDALRRSEQRFRLIADHMSDMVALHHLDGRYRYVSSSATRLLGYEPDELMGQNPYEYFHPEDVPIVQAHHSALLSGQTQSGSGVVYRLKRKDGTWVWVETRTEQSVNEDGEPCILTSTRDASERVRQETELTDARDRMEAQAGEMGRLAEDLHRARREAEEGSRAKSSFLAMMSHEVRTPLSGVMGTLDLLRQTRLTHDQRELAETMKASAENLLVILNDVLDFSKIEAGHLELEEVDYNLKEALESVVKLFKPKARRSGVALKAHWPVGVPEVYKGDPTRVRQVVSNLVGNAVKFTREGQVEVRLAHVVQTDGAIALRFEVQDTGVGMNSDLLDRLFKPFSQIDQSTRRKFGGTGLGLSICSRLVESMGGEIGVESIVGEGSTFWFTVLQKPGNPARCERLESEESLVHTSRPLRILLAEDYEINRRLFARMVGRMGHNVTTAVDGAEALSLVQATDPPFDVVLMDMQMPVMDGEEATRRIRELPGLMGQVPIVALSADAIMEHRARYMAAGLTDFMSKPVDWRRLETLLAHLSEEGEEPMESVETVKTPVEAASAPPEQASAPMGRTMLNLPPPEEAEYFEETTLLAFGPCVEPDDVPMEKPEHPLIDEARFYAMADEMGPEIMAELMAALQDSLVTEVGRLEEALTSADEYTVRRKAHGIKGMAANVGATRVAELAREMERGDPDMAGANRLRKAVEATVAFLSSI